MAKKFSIEVTGNDDEQPLNSSKESLHDLCNYLEGALAGTRNGDVTVKWRNTLVAASGTATCAAVDVNDYITINGTNVTAKQKNSTATVEPTSAQVNDTVTINGVVFTAKAAEDTAARQFNQSGTDAAAATSLAACVNASTHASISGILTAHVDFADSGKVVLRAYTAGTGGDALTLASSEGTRLAISGATFSGGAAAANNEFDCTGSNAETATALAAAINASTTALISGQVSASASSAVVTITALHAGVTGNAITLATSDGTDLAVSGARLTGGSAGGSADTYTSHTL